MNLQCTQTFWDLYAYSTTNRAAFWHKVLTYVPVIYTGALNGPVVDESAPIDSIPAWFPGLRVNFAENVLHVPSSSSRISPHGTTKADSSIAVTEIREGLRLEEEAPRNVTWGELRQEAGRLAGAMRARGLSRGDRVVVVGANSVDTLAVMLATTWLGAIFSSSSTDMGVEGLLQRIVQLDPKVSEFRDPGESRGSLHDEDKAGKRRSRQRD